jgi:small neutral amino acid transporter SnatA (MarC family)
MLTQMEQHLQAIVTVLSLVNPLICGVMFAQFEAGQTRAIRITDATKAALAVLVILLVAALAGARVLQIFGISLDAFSIAGGGVLTWIGFSILRGNSPQAKDLSKAGAAEKRSLTRPARAELPESSRSLLRMPSWRCQSPHLSRSQ